MEVGLVKEKACGWQKYEEQDYPRIRKEFGIVWLFG